MTLEARSIHVLVVEDDVATRHALEMLLRHYQYAVTSVGTVAAAVEQLGSKVDAVLLDLMLPDGDGITVLKAIRGRGLDCHVSVLTGVGDPERLNAVRTMQPVTLLQKPVDFLQILEKLPKGTAQQ